VQLKEVIGQLLVYGVLELGALCGVPMNPRKIEEIMQMTNRAKVEHVVRSETDDGDDARRQPRVVR
jgi:alkylated DNA nucleotide flippase Atl1